MTDGRYPLHSCLWELTLECNLRCQHCGSAAGHARLGELGLDECLAITGELPALGCEELTFIGGEIFLYRGWERVARAAHDLGMTVNIMTNAYGLREKQVEQVLYARLANIGISIDGLEENHNRIRGRPDSFAHIVNSLRLLREAGVPTGAVTSLLESNLGDLESLYEFLLAQSIEIWQIQLVNPMGYMTGRMDLILKSERIPALLEFIREKSAERLMTVVAADSVGYYYEDTEGCIRGRRQALSYWVGCQAGLTTAFIDSVGNVKGCGALYDARFIEGNVRERRLSEIWNDESKFAYNRGFTEEQLTGGCHGCFAADVCRGGCRASNYFNLGRLYENAYCPHNQPPSHGRLTQ